MLRDRELVGWIPGTEAVDTAPLAAEIARLGKENADLRSKLERASKFTETYNGLTFDEMYKLLLNIDLSDDFSQEPHSASLNQISRAFGDSTVGLIHLFWYSRNIFQLGASYLRDNPAYACALKLEVFGLIDISNHSPPRTRFVLNQSGKQFLLRLQMVRDVGVAEQYVLSTKFR